MSEHCADVGADRKRGSQTELEFCKALLTEGHEILAAHASVIAALGLAAAALPDNSHGDVVYRSKNNGHKVLTEVKGKYPTKSGYYGLEEYRVDGLIETKKSGGFDRVVYFIYNTADRVWVWRDLEALIREGRYDIADSKTYYGGETVTKPIYYFPADSFRVVEWAS